MEHYGFDIVVDTTNAKKQIEELTELINNLAHAIDNVNRGLRVMHELDKGTHEQVKEKVLLTINKA